MELLGLRCLGKKETIVSGSLSSDAVAIAGGEAAGVMFAAFGVRGVENQSTGDPS